MCKFEMWAKWCHDGTRKQSNMIAKMMDSGGYLTFGASNGSLDCLEATIESIIMKLAVECKASADVIRAHYGASNYSYLKMDVTKRANLLGFSVAKYYRLLNKAKLFVESYI